MKAALIHFNQQFLHGAVALIEIAVGQACFFADFTYRGAVKTFVAEQVQPKPKANILVAISGKNKIWIDRKDIDPRAVRAEFERLLAENPEGSVLIQADQDAYSETLMAVMAAAREAKVGVSISAEAP